jgi:hypothetical protein
MSYSLTNNNIIALFQEISRDSISSPTTIRIPQTEATINKINKH